MKEGSIAFQAKRQNWNRSYFERGVFSLRRASKGSETLHASFCNPEPHPSPPCLEVQEGEKGKDRKEDKEEKDEADDEGAGDETESEDPGHKSLDKDGGFGDGVSGPTAAIY